MGDQGGSGGDGKILDIKMADLKQTAPHFHTHSTDLTKALTKLKTALAAAGSPWGDDKQGKEFHKVYGPNVTKIEKAATILAQGLASIEQAMTDMADGHIDNEQLVRSMFSRIQVKHDGHGEGGGQPK
ncbi:MULTISPECIES: WXG100 family type VII secretion target [unclassified Streptomyces]|uniref:WXG100 family type VII secretion target n=1 Tax=unclassified Streptomyces TaxID=2593676 RepID=UPI00344ABF51